MANTVFSFDFNHRNNNMFKLYVNEDIMLHISQPFTDWVTMYFTDKNGRIIVDKTDDVCIYGYDTKDLQYCLKKSQEDVDYLLSWQEDKYTIKCKNQIVLEIYTFAPRKWMLSTIT